MRFVVPIVVVMTSMLWWMSADRSMSRQLDSPALPMARVLVEELADVAAQMDAAQCCEVAYAQRE